MRKLICEEPISLKTGNQVPVQRDKLTEEFPGEEEIDGANSNF